MSDDDMEKIVKHLATFGWSATKARRFATSDITYATLQIPVTGSVEILRMLCTEGVPVEAFTVKFIVPTSRFEAFKQVAEMAVNKMGGFFVTSNDVPKESLN